jgi:hypothetical protein
VSLIEMATRRFTNPATRKAQASSTAIVGGILLFTLFYGLCTLAVARLAGWSVAIWYGLSLPPSGLIAHYYWQHGLRFARSIRSTVLMARMPFTARRLVAMRKRLQAEIEDARREFRARGAASPAGVVN